MHDQINFMKQEMESIEAFTQEAVKEVFQSMVSLEMTPEPASPLAEESEGKIAGSVGFIGQINGVIYLYAGMSFAKTITGGMLGLSEAEVDGGDMVNDAIGELTNMVVGQVKSRLCDQGNSCVLTIPSIVRGQQLSVEASASVTRKIIGFRSGPHHMLAELLLKEVNQS
jgi:chemotaxis protein CheX